MHGANAMPQAPRRQRGVTLFGLLFWGVFIAFTFVVGAKVFPTVMEYWDTKKAVTKIAQDNPPTVAAARAAFVKQKTIEYSIKLSAEELQITKENDKVRISFAYEREIALGGPVYLLLKYEGSSQ